jgi:hypothetical protein
MSDGVLRADSSWTRLELPRDWRPTLTVVVDTEEEFDWSAPFDSRAVSTENIVCQPLAQQIMDRYGVVPTYVIDYPVADTTAASTVLKNIADDGRCEIGAHLHPWVCPPHEETISPFNSYPGNLSPRLERAKLDRLATRIEAGFGYRPVIYKAGRYGIGPATFAILRDLGFRIDVSVVPHTDFSTQYGPNFNNFPAAPFYTDEGIVALPLSVHFTGAFASVGARIFPLLSHRVPKRLRVPGMFSRLKLLERIRLSPEGNSLSDLLRQTTVALERGERYFMLTYHSSTLLPGATDYVRSVAERTKFLAKLDEYFDFFLGTCAGQTKSVSAVAEALTMSKGLMPSDAHDPSEKAI